MIWKKVTEKKFKQFIKEKDLRFKAIGNYSYYLEGDLLRAEKYEGTYKILI